MQAFTLIKIFLKTPNKILFNLYLFFLASSRLKRLKNLKYNKVLLLGSPPDSGLGFVVRSFFDLLKLHIKTQIIYLRAIENQKIKKSLKNTINIFIGNPYNLIAANSLLGKDYLLNNYNVGVWFWELETIPWQWRINKNWIDEIWVQSDFIFNTLKKINPKIYKIPFVVSPKPNERKNRSFFQLPEKKFIFLFAFDFWSYYERKNPEAIIRAFKKAFPSRKDVYLVIKTTHGNERLQDKEKLISIIKGNENIQLRDTLLSDEDYFSLLNQCDCYISLHRSEGLGLTMAEAMALGKPVIATNYSGNLEFMKDDNSCLVSYKLIPVSNYVSYSSRSKWADPDDESAAYFMRKIVHNKEFRKRISSKAASDMKSFSNKNMKKEILIRINAINKQSSINDQEPCI
jgi:glycosyltransferase involved in cell wall biosynthesis